MAAAAAASNLLEVDASSDIGLFRLLDGHYLDDFDLDGTPDFKCIVPTPAFCVKVKTDNNEKMFLNVCYSYDVPPPPATLDVHKFLSGEEHDKEALLNFPMSLGDPHIEVDKDGKGCKCYDVVINRGYFKEISTKNELLDFIMNLAFCGLERKYDISVDISTVVVLKKRYHGEMPPHYIRLKTPTGVMNVPKYDENVIMPVHRPLRLSAGAEVVKHKLFNVTQEGAPAFLVFQGLTRGFEEHSLRVFIGKSELTLKKHNTKIFQIPLPFDVIPQMSLSNFYENRIIVWMKKFYKGVN